MAHDKKAYMKQWREKKKSDPEYTQRKRELKRAWDRTEKGQECRARSRSKRVRAEPYTYGPEGGQYIPGRGHKKRPEDMHWGAAKARGHELTPEQRARKQEYERDYAQRTGRYRKQYEKTGRNAHRLRLYGITNEDYDALLTRQDFGCAICKSAESQPNRGLVVDHCHDSNVVRGLLCDNCNKSLGCMGESPERLEAAAAYLRRFK